MRVFSFAQESTRYCNYSKDKFGNELTFIIPSWFTTPIRPVNENQFLFEETCKNGEDAFIRMMKGNQDMYLAMIADGFKPQDARAILPNALKTELVMTGFIDDWNHFFDLRARGTTGKPHPDAQALAEPLMGEFYSRGFLKP